VCVDDLDRCSADYVVKVLEGMQTMFAHPDVVWIVAADRRWVAEAFEWKYPTSKSVAEPGNRLGYQFLEKAFQLTIALPEINDYEKGKFWRLVVGESSADEAEDEELTGAEERLRQQNTESGKLDVLGQLPPELAERLVGKVIGQMSSVEVDISVEHFLTRFSDVIKPNPRAMKRLVNSYTVYRDLAIPFTDVRGREPQGRAGAVGHSLHGRSAIARRAGRASGISQWTQNDVPREVSTLR
jgi:hypothetical protein